MQLVPAETKREPIALPFRFLDFGIWETFSVPVDPASPCRARSQTVLRDRARFQNSSSRSSSHAGVVPHSSSIREEFALIDHLFDFQPTKTKFTSSRRCSMFTLRLCSRLSSMPQSRSRENNPCWLGLLERQESQQHHASDTVSCTV